MIKSISNLTNFLTNPSKSRFYRKKKWKNNKKHTDLLTIACCIPGGAATADTGADCGGADCGGPLGGPWCAVEAL